MTDSGGRSNPVNGGVQEGGEMAGREVIIGITLLFSNRFVSVFPAPSPLSLYSLPR